MAAPNHDTQEYKGVISAMTATVTNTGTNAIQRLGEKDLVSKTYFEDKDYWLRISKSNINAGIFNLDHAGEADEDDVRGYAVDSGVCGGTNEAHFMRYILSKCTVINDPLETGKPFDQFDHANTQLELKYGDADIVILENIQDKYDLLAPDSGSLGNLIDHLASAVSNSDATVGMTDCPPSVYGDTNNEHASTKLSVACSVVGGGTMSDLFGQISELCGDSSHTLSTSGRSDSNDVADQFQVGDLLCLGDGSKFFWASTVSDLAPAGDDRDPSEAQIATEMDSSLNLWANKNIRANKVNAPTNLLYNNGKIFLEVVA
jgi:hypothetical protein